MNRSPQPSISASATRKTECASTPVSVIGIGSAFDDDQAGWLVIERLTQCARLKCDLHKASVPHDCLDWLSPATVVHLIDASQDNQPAVRRFQIGISSDTGTLEALAEPEFALPSNWPFVQVRSNSTHQFSLLDTLQLAATLGHLPKQLVLWTISIENPGMTHSLHPATAQRIELCAERIVRELTHA